ncbi:hypothetical protein ABPG77_005919 [Micractinium sp. CCAP 211/92]
MQGLQPWLAARAPHMEHLELSIRTAYARPADTEEAGQVLCRIAAAVWRPARAPPGLLWPAAGHRHMAFKSTLHTLSMELKRAHSRNELLCPIVIESLGCMTCI